jgi:hypothetical protein
MHLDAWQDLALEIDGKHHVVSHRQAEKLGYSCHRLGHGCLLRLGDSASLEVFSQQEDLGACPPSGTLSRVVCPLQERLKECPEVLCMKVYELTMSDKKKRLMMNIPLGSKDWDPFLGSRWTS